MESGKVLFGQNIRKKKQIASLTKMITLYVAIDLAQRFKTDCHSEKIEVSEYASKIGGTTARLKKGDIITLNDLFYGLMLPSGNDAAMACAEYFGNKLRGTSPFINNKNKRNRPSYYYFLDEMNEIAKKNGLRFSNFTNPHGLSDVNNYSTAEEVSKIAHML